MPSKRHTRGEAYVATEILEITAYDGYNRDTMRTYETTGGKAEAVAHGARVQAYCAHAIGTKQRFITRGSYATPTTPGTDSNTAKGVCFILNVTRPNGIVENVKDVFPCIKPGMLSGTDVNIGHADIVAWYDNYKPAGKLRLADGATLNYIVRGYAL